MTGQSWTRGRTDLATSDRSLPQTATQLPAACAHPRSPARSPEGKRCGNQAAHRGGGSHDLSSRGPYQNKRPPVRYFGITRPRVPSVVRLPRVSRRHATNPQAEIAGDGKQTTGIQSPTRQPPTTRRHNRSLRLLLRSRQITHDRTRPLHVTHQGKVERSATGPPTQNGPTPSNTPSSQPRRESLPHRVGHDAPPAPSATDPATTRSRGLRAQHLPRGCRPVAEEVRLRRDGARRVSAVPGSSRKGWPSGSRVGRGEPRLERSPARPRRGGHRSGLSWKRCRRLSRTAVVTRQEPAPASGSDRTPCDARPPVHSGSSPVPRWERTASDSDAGHVVGAPSACALDRPRRSRFQSTPTAQRRGRRRGAASVTCRW